MKDDKVKDILVIGLGRFGTSIVETLLARNQKVTVVDMSEEKVSRIANRCEFVKVCDTRNENTLRQLGASNFDHVVVAIGSSIESSIITTLLLKDMGIDNLTVKASNRQHQQAILKLGVPYNQVILPEHEMGQKIAHSIANPFVADYVSLEGDRFGIVELHPQKSSITGLALKDCNIKDDYNVNIAAIKRGNSVLVPDGNTIIEETDSLIIIGDNESIINFEQVFK